MRDMVSVKFSEAGSLMWSNNYGTTSNDNCYAACKANKDNGFLLVGNRTNASNQDIYIVKIDNFGNKMWDNTYEIPGSQYGYAVYNGKLQGYIIAGKTIELASNDANMFLLKITDDGTEVFHKSYGGTNTDEVAYSVVQPEQEGYTLGGSQVTPDGVMGYLINTDAYGDVVWEQPMEDNPGTEIHGLCITANNETAIVTSASNLNFTIPQPIGVSVVIYCHYANATQIWMQDSWTYVRPNIQNNNYPGADVLIKILLDNIQLSPNYIDHFEAKIDKFITLCQELKISTVVLGHMEDLVREDNIYHTFSYYIDEDINYPTSAVIERL
ncbi:MAG: hypothetical protein IPP29_18455 [Bacteroidetes bacterium]|nr:hypothetical protein [Bacteroidota bacterium]